MEDEILHWRQQFERSERQRGNMKKIAELQADIMEAE